jgi:hypothetical protein
LQFPGISTTAAGTTLSVTSNWNASAPFGTALQGLLSVVWTDPDKLISFVETIKDLRTYYQLGQLILSLQQQDIPVPQSLIDKYDGASHDLGANIGIDVLHSILDVLVDAAVDKERKSGILIPRTVAHSLADTAFNALTLFVPPKTAVENQIVDQSVLVVHEVAATTNDYTQLTETFVQAGQADLNYVRSQGAGDQKTQSIFANSIVVNESIAQELLNGVVWRVQSDAAIKLQIIDKILIGAVAQMNGHNGAAAAALSAARELAVQADGNAPIFAATAASGSNEFQNFAKSVAAQYNILGW